jgi:hypothetical protein
MRIKFSTARFTAALVPFALTGAILASSASAAPVPATNGNANGDAAVGSVVANWGGDPVFIAHALLFLPEILGLDVR